MWLSDYMVTGWLDSDSVVTIDNCQQHSNYTVDKLCSHHAAGKLTTVTALPMSSHRVVTVPCRWLTEYM